MTGDPVDRRRGDLDGWEPAELASTRDLTPTVREFTLRQASAPACQPGSHVRVRVETSGGYDHRCYSVVAHHGPMFSIAVKRQPESRGGSAYMWSLVPGDVLAVMPPGCDFPLSSGSPHYLLLAGGIGITPMMAMARQLVERGEDVRLVYAARSDEEFAYRDELERLLGNRARFLAANRGELVDPAAEIAGLPQGGELYMCGPLGLMEAVGSAWRAAGRPTTALRYETFGSSGRFAAQAFLVKVPRLDKEVPVAAGVSMLDALEAAGVGVVYDCRRGECGLCAVDVLEAEGTIDHRDVFFSERQHREGRRMCACVSRVAGGSVTIDPAWRGDGAFFPTA